MGVNYSPSIVKDSIVFNVDAANIKCYDPRENLLRFSQGGFNNTTYWTKGGGSGYTITDNTAETAAPDGTSTASKIVVTTPAKNGSSTIYQDFSVTSGSGTYTQSIYVKPSSGSGSVAVSSFLLGSVTNGIGGFTVIPISGTSPDTAIVIEDVGGGWKRYSITNTGTTAANNTYRLQMYFDNADNTTFYIWGSQVERKSSIGPYVATTTSGTVKPLPCNNLSQIPALESVTNNNRVMYDHRNSGSFTFDGSANFARSSTTYNFPGGGSVDVWFKLDAIGTAQGIFNINDMQADRVNIWYNNSTLRLSTSKAGETSNVFSTTVLAANTWYHAVGTWDSSSIYLYLNGSLQASLATANRPNQITGVATMGLYASNMTGNISAVKVYNKALSAAEVATNFNALRSRYSI
jgi:hypothetical protein